MALNPDIGQQVGWPRFVRTVNGVWRSIPAATRARTVIFTSYYGEAAAVDVLGRRLGLPAAYSAHNAFSEWGPPPDAPDRTVADVATATNGSVLLLGYDAPADARPDFVDCVVEAHVDDGVGLDNDEQGLPVMLCRTASTWRRLWSGLRHFN